MDPRARRPVRRAGHRVPEGALRPALILANCTIAEPFCAYLLKGYCATIPVEIDEAGRVDGLSPIGAFWRLALPLARPGRR